MWKEGNKVFFVAKVVERNVIAISNAAVELRVARAPVKAVSAPSSTLLVVKGFNASQIFVGIQSGIQGLSKEQRLVLVKKSKAVFAFEITNSEKKVQAWFVDMKVTKIFKQIINILERRRCGRGWSYESRHDDSSSR